MKPDPIFPGEQFDDQADDLDAWKADQERLRVLESAAHARIDRAALGILEAGELLPVEGSPTRLVAGPRPYRSALDEPGMLAPILLDGRTDRDRDLGITFCPVCREPAHATETDDEGRHPGCRDSDALDRAARAMDAAGIGWASMERFLGMMREQGQVPAGWSMQSAELVLELRDLIRSTGRGC